MTVITERLSELDALILKSGGHSAGSREYCFNEAAAWLAGEKHTDAPTCVSPVIRRYTMALNDRWNDEQRQTLKPYLTRVIGTAGDGKDAAREALATRFLMGPWLRLAGMDEEADKLTTMAEADPADIRSFLYSARREAWRRRDASYAALKAKVRERLSKNPAAAAVADAVADADAAAVAVADAAAAAVAVAVAVAAADAVADAVAVADAAAAADAVAVAAAAADAVAAAVAVAVADADAVAVADAVAAAAADAVADADPWRGYDAAYKAARQYFRDNPLAIGEKIQALSKEQAPLALVLLDQLIEVA